MLNNTYYALPDRQSMRLQNYDYRQPGYYYVTMCVAQRKCVLGEIVHSQGHLSLCGSIVESECNKLSDRFPHVHLDQYVIMPNHFHAILVFEGSLVLPEYESKTYISDRFKISIEHSQPVVLTSSSEGRKDKELPTLGEVVRTLKAACTYRIRRSSTSDFTGKAGSMSMLFAVFLIWTVSETTSSITPSPGRKICFIEHSFLSTMS